MESAKLPTPKSVTRHTIKKRITQRRFKKRESDLFFSIREGVTKECGCVLPSEL